MNARLCAQIDSHHEQQMKQHRIQCETHKMNNNKIFIECLIVVISPKSSTFAKVHLINIGIAGYICEMCTIAI